MIPGKITELIEQKTGEKCANLFQGGMTGVSTGALIVLALAAKKDKNDPNSQPLLSASKVVNFYKDHADNIFKCWTPENCCNNFRTATQEVHNIFCSKNCCCPLVSFSSLLLSGCGFCACFRNCGGMCGPKYSNSYLKQILNETFGDRTLKDVIVPVQIIAFNTRTKRPIYFNSIDHPNAKMADVALASASAPTFSPHMYLKFQMMQNMNALMAAYLITILQLQPYHLQRKYMKQGILKSQKMLISELS